MLSSKLFENADNSDLALDWMKPGLTVYLYVAFTRQPCIHLLMCFVQASNFVKNAMLKGQTIGTSVSPISIFNHRVQPLPFNKSR